MITISRRCPFTGTINEMTFNVGEDEFYEGVARYESGELLQNAFPFLDASEREFYMTGITPTEWDNLFGTGDE
jgi:hypothetical protein